MSTTTQHSTMAPVVAAERVVGYVRTRQWEQAEDIARHHELCHRYMTAPPTQEIMRTLWDDMPQSLRDVLVNLDDHMQTLKQ